MLLTLPATNMAPENGWLFSFWDGHLSGATLVSGSVIIPFNERRPYVFGGGGIAWGLEE